MRAFVRPRTLSLVLALTAGAPFLLDCDSSTSNGFDEEDEDSIPPPPRLLSFTYAPSDGRVTVRVDRSIAIDPKTAINARVRWGTLRYGGEDDLDCDALADDDGSAVSLTGEETSAGTEFPGPSVERQMERQYYEDNLIGIDATEDQLAAIARGTDPIVEGCLWQNGRVVARAQMSLYRAWDLATPDLVKRLQEQEAENTSSSDVTFRSVTTYGELCEKELGPNPFFPKQQDGTYATFDCTDAERSVVIPITVTSSSGGQPAEQTTEPSDGRCDHPDWLRRTCAPFARVNRVTNEQGTHWVLLCRKMRPGRSGGHHVQRSRDDRAQPPRETCFFQNGSTARRTRRASRTPPIHAPRNDVELLRRAHLQLLHDSERSPTRRGSIRRSTPTAATSPRIQAIRAFQERRAVPHGDEGAGRCTRSWSRTEAAPCTSCHRLSDVTPSAGARRRR